MRFVGRGRRGVPYVIVGAFLIAWTLSACGSSSKTPSATGSSATSASSTGASAAGATSGTGSCPTTPGVTATKVEVGVQSSQSGVESSYDGVFTPSAKAAIDAANAAGGVNGRQIVAVDADDQSSPTAGLSAVEGLVQSNGVFAVLNGSSVAPTIFPYLAQKGVPTFDVLPDSPLFGTDQNLFTAEGSWAPNNAGEEVSAFLQQLGITTVADFAHATPAGEAAANAINSAAEKNGVKVLYQDSAVPLQSFDVTTVALRLKQLQPQAVIEPLGVTPAISVIHSMQQQGFTPKATILVTGLDPNFLTAGITVPAYVETNFVQYLGSIGSLAPAAQAFREGMAKYAPGVTSLALYAAGGWATGSLFVHALQLAGKCPTRAGMISAMRAVSSYNPGGLEASAFSFVPTASSPDGGSMKCVNFVKISNGSFVNPSAPTCAP